MCPNSEKANFFDMGSTKKSAIDLDSTKWEGDYEKSEINETNSVLRGEREREKERKTERSEQTLKL